MITATIVLVRCELVLPATSSIIFAIGSKCRVTKSHTRCQQLVLWQPLVTVILPELETREKTSGGKSKNPWRSIAASAETRSDDLHRGRERSADRTQWTFQRNSVRYQLPLKFANIGMGCAGNERTEQESAMMLLGSRLCNNWSWCTCSTFIQPTYLSCNQTEFH